MTMIEPTQASGVSLHAAGKALAEVRSPKPEVQDAVRRVVIERVRPTIDNGRFPIKRTPGEQVVVKAKIFADGHDQIAALVRDRRSRASGFRLQASGKAPAEVRSPEPEADKVREAPMTLVSAGDDEWRATFTVDEVGWHEFEVVAWVDRFRSWRHEIEAKARAPRDLSV